MNNESSTTKFNTTNKPNKQEPEQLANQAPLQQEPEKCANQALLQQSQTKEPEHLTTPPSSPRTYQMIIEEALNIKSQRNAAISIAKEKKRIEREKNKSNHNQENQYFGTKLLFSNLNVKCKLNNPSLFNNFEDDEDHEDYDLNDNNIKNTSSYKIIIT